MITGLDSGVASGAGGVCADMAISGPGQYQWETRSIHPQLVLYGMLLQFHMSMFLVYSVPQNHISCLLLLGSNSVKSHLAEGHHREQGALGSAVLNASNQMCCMG